MNIKKSMLTALFGTSALLLAACGTPAEEETTGESAESTPENESLIVYTNSNSDGRGEWLTEQAAEAGYDIEIVGAGGGDLLNRLIAEKNAPIADVVFGMDETSFFQLQSEDLLVNYEPAWVDNIPADANIGEGDFHPLVEQRIFMIYNPEFISEEETPDTWEELGNNEEFHDIYKIPNHLGGSTNQKAVISILAQYRDDAGEHGVSEEGWEEVTKYIQNGYLTPDDESFQENFVSGKIPLSFTYISGIPASEEEFGFTAEPINPEYGVVTMREEIGIINHGEDEDYSAEQGFIDWFGSAEVQSGWAEEFGSLPVNEDAIDSAQPRIQELAESTTPMDIDWVWVSENLDGWIEKIELEIY